MPDRRTYLASLGGAAAGLVAGCQFFTDAIAPTTRISPSASVTEDFPEHLAVDRNGETLVTTQDTTAVTGNPGSAFLFEGGDGEWTEAATFEGDSGVEDFADAIALSGDGTTALVSAKDDIGTFQNDVPADEGDGSVAVFTRGDGAWDRQATLTPTPTETFQYFGRSLDLSRDGRTALVGASNDVAADGFANGAASVFSRDGETWTRTGHLIADDGDAFDFFGRTVALSADGSTAVVGAWGDELDASSVYENYGALYVFAESGGEWSQRTKLTATPGRESQGFGERVAISADGSTILAGDTSASGGNGDYAGVGFVFTDADGRWEQRATLAADDGNGHEYLGDGIALDGAGETALLGATDAGDSGTAYLFRRSEGEWEQQATLTAAEDDGVSRLADAVALSHDGTTAFVSAQVNGYDGADGDGWTYVYDV